MAQSKESTELASQKYAKCIKIFWKFVILISKNGKDQKKT